MIYRHIIAATFCLLTFSAWGADGRQLLQSCTIAENMLDGRAGHSDLLVAGICNGVIRGAIEASVQYREWAPSWSQICVTGRPDGEQLLRIFLNYARANPKQWDQDEAVLVILAFKEAYPCPEK